VKIGRLLLIGAVLAVGCAHPHPYRNAPTDEAWLTTLDSAQQLAADSQYAAADTLLIAFALSSPESAGAYEATFWHGVFLLEPANTQGSAKSAADAFDSYVRSGAEAHRAEAVVLKRASRVIDSLSKARSMDSVPAVHLLVSDDSAKLNAREAEMAKTVRLLQDSLNKTTAELDRIKKRLSTGKP
jgi:hypothetical protein